VVSKQNLFLNHSKRAIFLGLGYENQGISLEILNQRLKFDLIEIQMTLIFHAFGKIQMQKRFVKTDDFFGGEQQGEGSGG
jgi:hypothetical protein